MGPEQGPFECERCLHWQDPNACQIVSGDIDPHGCCNLFAKNPSSSEENEDETQGPAEGGPATDHSGQGVS